MQPIPELPCFFHDVKEKTQANVLAIENLPGPEAQYDTHFDGQPNLTDSHAILRTNKHVYKTPAFASQTNYNKRKRTKTIPLEMKLKIPGQDKGISAIVRDLGF